MGFARPLMPFGVAPVEKLDMRQGSLAHKKRQSMAGGIRDLKSTCC